MAFFPVSLSNVYFQEGWPSKGLPEEFKLISSGRSMGSSDLSTGLMLHLLDKS